MPPENPLREQSEPREQLTGDEIINTRTQRVVRITNQDGIVQDVLTDVHDSRPDGNGGYIETDVIHVATDAAGNTFPEDPHSLEAISSTGLYVKSVENQAECTSWLHTPGRSRTIRVGQDGRRTVNGAICTQCDFWIGTIYLTIGIIAVGLILGIWKGVGLF
ncbi:MAG: hypothetical protein U9N86_16315 [Bacteroidota bacterium]|nr:hypothetical protein [Bacteroidota bacterium]